MRARYPDCDGTVVRDGVGIRYERYGRGRPAILLLPTWSLVHSRHWKMQVAYLARHFTVVCSDGRVPPLAGRRVQRFGEVPDGPVGWPTYHAKQFADGFRR